jgi:hypothetical protein
MTFAAIPDFWKQDQLTLSLVLTFFILVAILVVGILYKYRIKIAGILKSRPVLLVVRTLLYLVATATIITFILSFIPRGMEQGLGGLVFFVLWPLLIVQVFVAVLPWNKLFLKEPLLGLLLLIFYCNVAVNIIIAVLKFSGY